ncbi:MAG: hypothetical protein M3T49_06885 [Candidatus Eremiobacteraeota bacterium]|nr:hypothetical protein [Candidatus Eremiobacteraeota bacterium]
MLGFCNATFSAALYPRESTEQKGYDCALSLLRERMSEDELEGALAEGLGWSEERAVEEALRL